MCEMCAMYDVWDYFRVFHKSHNKLTLRLLQSSYFIGVFVCVIIILYSSVIIVSSDHRGSKTPEIRANIPCQTSMIMQSLNNNN